MPRQLTVIVLLGLLSPGASGEGAVKLLDCTIVRICDAGGNCERGTGEVRFRMQPQELESAGAGQYVIEYDDTRADMQAFSDAGPFLWNFGSERNALVASSAAEWLWHRLVLEPEPTATVRFLSCTFQQ